MLILRDETLTLKKESRLWSHLTSCIGNLELVTAALNLVTD